MSRHYFNYSQNSNPILCPHNNWLQRGSEPRKAPLRIWYPQ
ncbi:transcriptional regulator [Escherichia coli]|nr:transcriptional regulator [Escherichia coli]